MNFRQWTHRAWQRVNARPHPDRAYTQADVDLVLRAAVEALIDELVDGDELYISDLGRLSTQKRPARTVASHVGEGGRYHIPARRAAVFSPSKALTRRLNAKSRG